MRGSSVGNKDARWKGNKRRKERIHSIGIKVKIGRGGKRR